MNKSNIGASARIAGVVLVLITILPFSFGVAVAGRFVVQRIEHSHRPTKPIGVVAGLSGVLFGSHAAPKNHMPIEGKGMWIWQFGKIAGGDPNRIVRSAVAQGLTHIYVRAGSSVAGLSGWKDIVRILPVAHRAGLKVIAWDFPYLRDPARDIRRAKFVVTQSVDGHHVDGFAADVETPSEGTMLTISRARNYARGLRAALPGRFLILVPPPPNKFMLSIYPYNLLVPSFDAVAPMIYWGRRKPDEAASQAMHYLRRFGKPVAPIGQSFDMGPEGGPKGAPNDHAVIRFMNEARIKGAVGVSFWSWQHTPARLWRTIHAYPWPARRTPG